MTTTATRLTIIVDCEENPWTTLLTKLTLANEFTIVDTVLCPLGTGIRTVSHHSSPPETSVAGAGFGVGFWAGASLIVVKR